MFNNKIFDFLASFGMMLFGVIILFYFSVTCYSSGASCVLPYRIKHISKNNEPKVTLGENYYKSHPAVPLAKNDNSYSQTSTAVSAIVIDAKTKYILYEKNKEAIRPLASISKLMSAMVLMDLPMRWASTTVITDSDMETGDHHVSVGEKYTLQDLWNIALIGSSNIAMSALARNSGLSPKEFASRMNKKAQDLRLYSLRFSEPTGLSAKNAGNVLDIAKLLQSALKYEKILSALQTGEYYAQPLNAKKQKQVWTTNWLLTDWIPNHFAAKNIAGKTGYIIDSDYNFAVSLTDDKKHTIITVVLGTESNEARFIEARDLSEWVFGHYVWPDEEGYGVDEKSQ